MPSEVYFFIRHTPFWAIPALIIGLEFAYVFWLRKKKTGLKLCIVMVVISSIALGWY